MTKLELDRSVSAALQSLFDQATDAVIEVTGLSGTINASHFVTS